MTHPDPPDFIVCSITQEVMKDPVMTTDGQTYEKEAIMRWFRSSDISPNTGSRLVDKSLKPNLSVKNMIDDWWPVFKKTNIVKKITKKKQPTKTKKKQPTKKQPTKTKRKQPTKKEILDRMYLKCVTNDALSEWCETKESLVKAAIEQFHDSGEKEHEVVGYMRMLREYDI
jgi:hypothetical protein